MDEQTHSSTELRVPDSAKPVHPRGRWRRICVKELKETLRDRRTVVTLVLMPLLVYPLLSVVFQRFFVTSLGSLQQSKIAIGTDSDESGARLKRLLLVGDALLSSEPDSPKRVAALKNANSEEPDLPRSFSSVAFYKTEKPQAEVENGNLALAVIFNTQPQPKVGSRRQQVRCELVSRENSSSSTTAMRFVRDRLEAVNNEYLRRQVAEAGVPVQLPVVAKRRTIPSDAEPLSLTTLIPLILILMTITGAVYPAIDLTAGERERGTLEPLMAAPVPRIRLLLAKYVAVVVVALLTAVANIVAMTVTLASSGLGRMLFGESGLTFDLVFAVFALLVLFAAFFSAIVLALSSFARSFKEAQAYLIPLMLLCLAPGVMSLMPGLEFTRILAITPLVNIVVLARDLFEGSVDPVLACMAVGSTVLYALAAICLAARIFGTDAILYGSQATWSDFLRRPNEPRDAATTAGAAWCLALTFPICVTLLSSLGRVPASMSVRIALSGVATAVVFGGVPLACALFQRVRFRSGFSLRASSPLAFVAALILGVSLWPFARELFLFNQTIGLDPLVAGHEQQVVKLLGELRAVSPIVILLSLALAPAIFEEFLFRGFLYTAIRQKMPAAATIVLTAVVFGGFHVVAANSLSPEKFLPSTFLGLILGWVRHKSGSVIPGMFLHACHNGLMLMIVHQISQGSALPEFLRVSDTGHLSAIWYVVSSLAVFIGLAILAFANTRDRQAEPSEPT